MIYALCVLLGVFLGGLIEIGDTLERGTDCGLAAFLGALGLIVLGLLYVGKTFL